VGEDYQGVENKKARKIWVAIILSILAPGLGQIYCGHLIRGIVFLCLLAVVGLGKDIILLIAVNQPHSSIYICHILVLSFYILAIVDSVLLAKRYRYEYETKRHNRWYVYTIVFAIGFFLIRPLTLHGFVIQAYIMPTVGMWPIINEGDRFLVDHFIYESRYAVRGDIVVFESPVNPRVKYVTRIIGLPGDTIEIKDKNVYINGNELHEMYVVHWDLAKMPIAAFGTTGTRDNLPPTLIPQHAFFVMSDNRSPGALSDMVGFLYGHQIKGKVKVIYYSSNRVVWKTIENPVYKS
jgi:signal peptidase I